MMNKKLQLHKAALIVLALIEVATAYGLETTAATDTQTTGPSAAGAEQQSQEKSKSGGSDGNAALVTNIMALCDARYLRIDGQPTGNFPASGVGLNDMIWVVVRTSQDPELDKLAVADQCAGLALIADNETSPETPSNKPATDPTKDPAQNLSAGAERAAAQAKFIDSGKEAHQKTLPGAQLDGSQYELFLDGIGLGGLEDTIYDGQRHAFRFHLTRSRDNKAVWTSLLGSPTHSYRRVTVALGLKEKDRAPSPTIVGQGKSATFELQVFSCLWLWIAVAAVAVVLVFVIGTARTTTTLRDCLLPQLPANQQPYSLGRCQMAFWFVLVFASFVLLYVMLWDYNTVSPQALALMGISSGTALAAVAVDIIKDSPADKANRALQALGLNTYADVLRIQQEIDARQPQVPVAQVNAQTARATANQAKAASDGIAANPAALADQKAAAAKTASASAELADAADRALKQIQAEIQDRQIVIRTYQDKSRPFRSEGLFKDITTDLNGPTVHRLQVVFWTLALGAVFAVGVYHDLAMPPDFSGTLLALMGLSGAGYVGFKYPEKNN